MTSEPSHPRRNTWIRIVALLNQSEKATAAMAYLQARRASPVVLCFLLAAGCASAIAMQPNSSAPPVTISVTGQASINLPLTFTRYFAKITGCRQSNITWEVNNIAGGSAEVGTISAKGVYQAPSVMPAQNHITVNAVSTYCTPYSGSMAVTLLQPIPVVTTATATSSDGGATVQVHVTAKNMVAGAALLVQGAPVASSALSSLELQATLASPGVQDGKITVAIANPSPGPEQSSSMTVPLVVTKASARAAARFLEQSTFGPTAASIAQVQSEGLAAFLANQFQQHASTIPAVPYGAGAVLPAYCQGYQSKCVDFNWLQFTLTGNDQLRQRVAFALSHIFVVSENTVRGAAFPLFLNALANDAFSNWSTILHDVTLSPAMGNYLNMLNNARAPAGQIPNENFARESLQLFSIGVNKLHMDGSLVLGEDGKPEPNYTEAQVEAFARVYTGWTFANADGSKPGNLLPVWYANWNVPMVAVEDFHDTSAKTLLQGVELPAGQSAEEDLSDALKNIFDDPSLPPFVCKQLIQHLVTSNPSPAYVSRVANTFVDSGTGVRGDMRAVITAILMDPEARAGDTEDSPASFGHLREPTLWLSNVMRGLGAVKKVSDPSAFSSVYWFSQMLSEPLHEAPSVFDFFAPGHTLANSQTLAPEFELETTATILEKDNLSDWIVDDFDLFGFPTDLSATSTWGQLAARNPQALLDQLNLIFMHSAMSPEMNRTILNVIDGLKDPAQMARVAVYLIITSPQYKIYS